MKSEVRTPDVISEIDCLHTEWLDTYNTDIENIGKFYMKDALLFYGKHAHLKGTGALKDHYRSMSIKAKTLSNANTLYRIRLEENPDMVYEAGSLTTKTNENYQYITIWSRFDGKWLRELEAISEMTAGDGVHEGIDKARDEWVRLANRHTSLDLVSGIYSGDFVYYNRGVVCQGYDNLAEAYDYMNYPDFNITLKKDICTLVKSDLAYEIGKYNSNAYQGSYIIIWTMQQDGTWKIRLDANW